MTQPNPRHVLVVDDNADGADMLATFLEFEGHDVKVATSGADAVEIAIATKPDLVLLDISLPDLDGYEVARRIRSADEGRRVRLVALTGHAGEEDRARSRAAGFAAHLVKPVDFDVLRRVLAEV
jgi:CheY-like chemotaxis protein